MDTQTIECGQYDIIDSEVARKFFKAAFRTRPMTRIEVIKVAGGCDVYRVTVVESSWK